MKQPFTFSEVMQTMESSRGSAWDRIISRPVFWAMMMTAGFYTLMFQPSMADHFLRQYTTHHVTEYVIVVLLFWAAADLALRLLGLRRERRALTLEQLPTQEGLESIASAEALHAQINEAPAWWRQTRIGRRLHRALAYVALRKSADGFRDYLKALADEDADETHTNYSFARFVAAITPVLGLLGTVVHFGVALGALSLERLIEDLPTVVSHMGTAFNTTCAALSVSMTTLFALFMVERIEQLLVRDIDRRVEDELLNRFATADASLTPFLDAVEAAKQVTLEAMQEFQQQQAEFWATTLAQDHDRRLAQDNAQYESRETQLRQWLAAVESRQSEHAAKLESSTKRLADVAKLTSQVAEMAGGEKRLTVLQSKLVENLELIHRSQKFDEAMHSLTAAIHLLTARQPGVHNKAA